MEIYVPYKDADTRAMILNTQTSPYVRDHVAGNTKYLVFDDSLEIPFDIPDAIIKAGFVEMLSMVNNLNSVASQPIVTPQEFLAAVRNRL